MKNNLMTPREDTWGFMQLQNCILNIAKYIHDFCIENGIEYFSWWAAYLNKHSNNEVIAPAVWTNMPVEFKRQLSDWTLF